MPKVLLAQARAFYKEREKAGGAAIKLEAEAARLEKSIAGLQMMIDKGAGDAAKAVASILAKQQRLSEIAADLRDAGRIVKLPTERQAEAAQRRIVNPEIKDRLTFADKRSILEGIQDLRMEYFDGDLTITGAIPMPPEAASSGQNKCNSALAGGYTYSAPIPFKITRRVA